MCVPWGTNVQPVCRVSQPRLPNAWFSGRSRDTAVEYGDLYASCPQVISVVSRTVIRRLLGLDRMCEVGSEGDPSVLM